MTTATQQQTTILDELRYRLRQAPDELMERSVDAVESLACVVSYWRERAERAERESRREAS